MVFYFIFVYLFVSWILLFPLSGPVSWTWAAPPSPLTPLSGERGRSPGLRASGLPGAVGPADRWGGSPGGRRWGGRAPPSRRETLGRAGHAAQRAGAPACLPGEASASPERPEGRAPPQAASVPGQCPRVRRRSSRQGAAHLFVCPHSCPPCPLCPPGVGRCPAAPCLLSALLCLCVHWSLQAPSAGSSPRPQVPSLGPPPCPSPSPRPATQQRGAAGPSGPGQQLPLAGCHGRYSPEGVEPVSPVSPPSLAHDKGLPKHLEELDKSHLEAELRHKQPGASLPRGGTARPPLSCSTVPRPG